MARSPATIQLDRAIGDGERPMVARRTRSPTASAATYAADRSRAPCAVVQTAVGQRQQEVERDRGHEDGCQRREVPRCRSDAVQGLGLAAGRQRNRCDQRVEAGEQVEGRHAPIPLGPGARVSTNPTSAQATVRPNATALTGASPPGTEIAQSDDDAGDREPQDEDLEQPERPERRRPRCSGSDDRAVAHLELRTSPPTVIVVVR